MGGSSFYITFSLKVLFGTILIQNSYGTKERNVTITWPCPGLNLVQVTAKGSADNIQYLFGSISIPSLFVARTAKEASVQCNCTFLNSSFTTFDHSITINPSPSSVYVLLFNRLFEYRDINNTIKLPLCVDSSCVIHRLNELTWNNIAIDNDLVTLAINTSGETLKFLPNGFFSIDVQVPGEESRMDHSPHLKYISNTSLVTLTLNNLDVHFNESRFSLELVTFSSDDSNVASHITESRSVDDEYSPGIFIENNWIMGENLASVQWRPVAYLSPDRKITVDSVTKVLTPDTPTSKISVSHQRSLALAYFGQQLSDHSTSALNVSFGKKSDDFYIASKYTVWVFSVGLGEPPVDKISLGMILIIAIGLGIPMLILLLSFVWLAVKKRSRSSAYENITSPYGSIQT